jgi:hypothetical protein
MWILIETEKNEQWKANINKYKHNVKQQTINVK